VKARKYEVGFSAEAVADLDRLYIYISQKANFEIADGYLARIEHLCDSLSTFPKRGAEIKGRISGLRRMGFEHRVTILFRVGEKRVEILRILYGGQDLEKKLAELPEG
jgi:toxin ParE1/3/4